MAKTKAKTTAAKKTAPSVSGSQTTSEPAKTRSSSTFKKVISRPNQGFGMKKGKLVPSNMTEERLRTLASTANEQIAAGHKIYGPPRHYKDGKIIGEGPADRFVFDADANLGHWKKFDFVEDASLIDSSFKPGPALVGEFEAPGDPSDPNTPAGKVGTTLQEVSPLILPSYTDGTGREWTDFLGHVALPVHAMEPGQDNFALAMSAEAPDDEDGIEVVFSDIAASDKITGAGTEQPQVDDPELMEVLEMLRQPPHNLDLPEETTRDSFIPTLRIAVRQSVASARQVDTMSQPPQGSSSRPSPIAMSAEMDDNNTPKTDPMVNALVKAKVRETKEGLHAKLTRLHANGIIQKEANVNALKADIEAISFSAEDLDLETGEFPTPYVAKQLALLESEGRPLTGHLLDDDAQSFSAPEGADLQEPPAAGIPDLPAEEVTAIMNQAGLSPAAA